jgi:cyanophycin synthetase
MEVSRIRALRGPNLWTRHTAVEAMVTCEAGEVDLSEHPDLKVACAIYSQA